MVCRSGSWKVAIHFAFLLFLLVGRHISSSLNFNVDTLISDGAWDWCKSVLWIRHYLTKIWGSVALLGANRAVVVFLFSCSWSWVGG